MTPSKRLTPNNQPPPPSFLGCLFGWLGPLRSKRESGVDESIQVPVKEK